MARETKEPVFITVNGQEDTVIIGHAQYRKMKAELELLKKLADAQADVDNERTAPIEDTFSDIHEALFEMKAYGV